MIKNRLKEVRTEKGITQTKLAEMTGISRQTLNKIEGNSEANVNTSTIAKISEALEKKPSEIFLF